METANQGAQVKDLLNQKAKARLREMRATTKATARDLGLPPAAEPVLLATLYDTGSKGTEMEDAAGQPSAPRRDGR